MAETTANFRLIKPAESDFYNVEVFNNNADIIDGAVEAVKNTANAAKVDEYAYFMDDRAAATAGYWHKMFTCRIDAYDNTDINIRLAVQQLYNPSGDSMTDGILNISIRENAAGVFSPSYSHVQWESCAKNVNSKLN